MKGSAVLDCYRVLDLSDERGQMAGAILAGLGADVLLVEPPDGSHSRRVGPWLDRDRDRQHSLSHWVHNRGKRSVVLDLAHSEPDRDELRRLAAGADVLIESATPGDMTSLGLDYEALRDLNPALVYVSISPFGQNGPKARWPATDLTVWASAMVLVLTGDADRAPVRISLPQAFLHAGADAAGGALLALYERGASGLGQHVDISAQASSLPAAQAYVLAAPLRSVVPRRSGGGARLGTYDAQFVWRCRDGYVAVTVLFGAALGPFTARLMAWIHEEGFCDLADAGPGLARFRCPPDRPGPRDRGGVRPPQGDRGLVHGGQDQARAVRDGPAAPPVDRPGEHDRGRGRQRPPGGPRLLGRGGRPGDRRPDVPGARSLRPALGDAAARARAPTRPRGRHGGRR